MSALANKRITKLRKFSTLELPGKAEQVFQGGIACWDTSTGLVAKAFVSTTLHPIGYFTPSSPAADGSVTTPASGTVEVTLFREIEAAWFNNDGTVVAGTLGNLCYLLDDQTVSNTDNTNTRSAFGRVWAIDTVRGVLVEPLLTAGAPLLTGLDQ
jgi:hypothetical protein